MLHWAARYNIFCFLDDQGYAGKHNSFDCVLAAGATRSINVSGKDAFTSLQKFYDLKPSWLFGHFGYSCKTAAKNVNGDFEPGFFFEPEVLLRLTGSTLLIETGENAEKIFKVIEQATAFELQGSKQHAIQETISKEGYIQIIDAIKDHIKRGDCYEINFCQEFFSEGELDPLTVFLRLQQLSPNPFSAFYKVNNNFCLCASPERFLKKEKDKLISQPIKGTSKRNSDAGSDALSRAYLASSEKEKSENIMVVDLVRNDLSRVCEEGSVQVEEMFGIYPYPQVYQMISTITGTMQKELLFTNAIEACFPMGSMTGAPKIKVMELIQAFEEKDRGLFSGAIGYIDPQTNFDFNVVIRSIFYNAISKRISFWAGSGITFYSDAASEYDECLAKVAAIKSILEG
ncbi:MAG: anthranilate synthase component I family protein [Ferruginibacter sp.]